MSALDTQALKAELDQLYAKLNEPKNVVPEWCDSGLSSTELDAIEQRLNVTFPASLRQIVSVFAGIHVETPYHLGHALTVVRQAVHAKKALRDWEIEDLSISDVSSPAEWGNDELCQLHQVTLEGMADLEITAKRTICLDAQFDWLDNPAFIMIGTSYSESVYINLIEGSPTHGAIYNVQFVDDHLLVHKIADHYTDFVLNLKRSLQQT